jgi:hypothetical protein
VYVHSSVVARSRGSYPTDAQRCILLYLRVLDFHKSLKLRELIVNVLARFTYDCWAIYPAIFRLLNLRVHADRWSPPTNDQMAVPEGETYDSEGTGIGIHTRLAYISQNENLYRLLLQSSEETVRWAT